MAIDMKLYDKAWSEAKAPEGLEDLPDGRYSCEFEEHRFSTVRQGEHEGTPRLALAFVVQGGASAGRWIWKNHTLHQDAEKLGFVRGDLAVLGADVERPGDGALEAALEAAVGTTVRVRLRTNEEGFQNVYLAKERTAR